MNNKDLIKKAKEIAIVRDANNGFVSGEVGSVLLTKTGKFYKGVSIDARCGIGFCGEHAAIAAMLTDGESEIDCIVAVDSDGKVCPPCGRCREMIYQVNHLNINCKVILSEDKSMKLEELLPLRWQECL